MALVSRARFVAFDWGSAVARARAEPFHYPNGYEELDQRLTRL
jgi:hypothetical protein